MVVDPPSLEHLKALTFLLVVYTLQNSCHAPAISHDNTSGSDYPKFPKLWFFQGRAVAKITNCWVYATSSQEIEQLGSSFGSIFLLFPMKVARDQN